MMTTTRTDSQQASEYEAPMPLICDVLAQRNEVGDLTVKKFESLLDMAPRSGYPFFSHRVLDAKQLRQLFRGLKDAPAAQQALLNYLADGTGWVCYHVARDKDINRDGCVNTSDVLDGTIKALSAASDALNEARAAERSGFQSVSSQDAQAIAATLHEVIGNAVAAINVLDFLSAHAPRQIQQSLSGP
jgi:hypothetical protein